jgi:hypothetical protein
MKKNQSKRAAIASAEQYPSYSEIMAEKRERGEEEFLAPGTVVRLDPITYDDLVPDSVNSVELNIAGLKFSVEKQHPVFRHIIENAMSIWNGTVSVTEKEHASTANRPTPFLSFSDFIIARRSRGVRHFLNRFEIAGRPLPPNIRRMIDAGSYYRTDEAYGHKADRSFLNGVDEGATAVVWSELCAMGYVMEETVEEKKASAKAAGLLVIIRG